MNEQLVALGGRKWARALCLVAVVAVLVGTLSPFNPFPRNRVTWVQGTSGLKFERGGVVVSNAPLRPAGTETGSYSLELLLRPVTTRGVHTILVFCEPARPRQFTLRQWTDSLIVTHDASVNSDRTRTIKIDVDHALHLGRLALVTISSGPNGTTVYLDGQPAQSFPGFKISGSELWGELIFGTSPITYQPWSGELHGLAVYSKELTPTDVLHHYRQWIEPSGNAPDLDGAIARYTFTEASGHEVRNEVPYGPNLEIPAAFSVPHKILLQSAAKEFKADWAYLNDVLVNIAGFVPLGLIVCAYFGWTRSRWQAILIAAVTCGLLSFSIEVLQYYIPQRGSGTTDIITNTLGAALGAVLTQAGPIRRVLLQMKLIRTVQ